MASFIFNQLDEDCFSPYYRHHADFGLLAGLPCVSFSPPYMWTSSGKFSFGKLLVNLVAIAWHDVIQFTFEVSYTCSRLYKLHHARL